MADVFNFSGPGQVDISGVLAGASGILQGGQAKGAGLAAAGQAKGQAYAAIGQSVASGIEAKAREKKEEERNDAITKYLDSAEDPKNTYDAPWMDIENTNDPNLQAMYDRSLRVEGDPDAIRAQLHSGIIDYYMTQHGKDRIAATNFADDQLRIETDPLLTPEARASLSKARNELIALGVSPAALHSLTSARGMKGYPTEKSRLDARTKAANDKYGFKTEAEKLRLDLQKEDAVAQQKRARALQQEQETERAIRSVISEPITIPVPTPFGVPIDTPTGMMRRRGLTQVSVGGVTGVSEQFEQRASDAGYPVGALRRDLEQQETVSFVGQRAVTDVRRLLRDSGMPETAIDRELIQRRIFSDQSDPNFRKGMDERVKEIERRHLVSEAPLDRTGGFTNTQQRYIQSMSQNLDRNMQAGATTSTVPLGQLTNVDMDAVALAIKSVPGTTASKDQLAKMQIGLDAKGDVIFKGGGGISDAALTPTVRAKLKAALGTQAIRREVAYLQAAGSFEGRTKMEINTFMEHLRINDPARFKALMRAGGGAAAPAAQAPPTQLPPQAVSDLTPGEAALLGDPTASLTSGARISSPPNQAGLDAASRERQGRTDVSPADLGRAATTAVREMQAIAVRMERQGKPGFASKLRKDALALQEAGDRKDWVRVQEILKRLKGK